MNSPQQFLRWWSESLLAVGGVKPDLTEQVSTSSINIGQRRFDAILTPEFSRSARDDQVRRAIQTEKIALQRHGLEPDCPLCRNIARSEIIPSLAIKINQHHTILPNRYPSQLGAALLVSNNHLAPSRGSESEHLELLSASAIACKQYDLIAVKNHPLDGMSLPRHDHIHLWPRELASAQHVVRLIEARADTSIASSDASPFDSRIFSGPDNLKFVAQLLAHFDNAGVVYTYAQVGETVMLSPRVPSSAPVLISLTGPLHIFSPPYSRTLLAALSFIPLAGCFDWDKFIPAQMPARLARAA